MNQLQRNQREQTSEIVQHLLALKLLSNEEAEFSVREIAKHLNEKIIAITHRLQERNDLSEKINLISAQLTYSTAINLLVLALSNDTKNDTRRINALLYMR